MNINLVRFRSAAFVVLAIPTAFMGATLPLLTKYVVQSEEQIGPRVGLLYATNTVGAVGGTVVAGFMLLPALGLAGTVYVGVAINFLVFLIAAAIAKAVARESEAAATADKQEPAVESTPSVAMPGRSWALPIMLLSGANSFIYEVLWTRLLGPVQNRGTGGVPWRPRSCRVCPLPRADPLGPSRTLLHKTVVTN